jgi:predicted transcriptional regulator
MITASEPLTLTRACELLKGEVLSADGDLNINVERVGAADLMSDVLAFSSPDALLITGLTSVQSVHTAHVADCVGILFVSGKRPTPEALQLARDMSIPLLSTPRSMFEACGVLASRGVAGSVRS